MRPLRVLKQLEGSVRLGQLEQHRAVLLDLLDQGCPIPLRAPLLPAVVLAPYDLREMAMLGDSGSNSLGALLALNSVDRFTGRSRWLAIGALAGLNLLGELRSLGEVIERSPVLRDLDRLGRQS